MLEIQVERRPRRRLIVFTITPWAAVIGICLIMVAAGLYLCWRLG